MSTPNEQERLALAADLVAGVAGSLNDAAEPCPCCGLRVAENLSEMRLAGQLRTLSRRLREAVDQLHRLRGYP